jgi:hypothetical protein
MTMIDDILLLYNDDDDDDVESNNNNNMPMNLLFLDCHSSRAPTAVRGLAMCTASPIIMFRHELVERLQCDLALTRTISESLYWHGERSADA